MSKIYPLFSNLTNIFTMSNQQFLEEDLFVTICETLLLEGDIPENRIEKKAHQILNNPKKYPEYFPE